MSRWLAALLACASLVAVAPPAQASSATGPVVTLRASATEVAPGDVVVLAGRAKHSRPGSKVLLQRRTPTGWTTLAEKRTRDDRSFRFQRRPTLGAHRLRVVKPRQLGQARAVSPVVLVSVAEPPPPTPQLEVTASTGINDNRRGVLVLAGHVSGLGQPVITVERRYGSGGAWTELGEPTSQPGPDGAFELEVFDQLHAQLRVVARSGDGLAVLRSQVFANSALPYHLDLNSTVSLWSDHAAEADATILVAATQGDEVAIGVQELGGGTATVTAPGGAEIDTIETNDAWVHFVAGSTGDYVISLSDPGYVTVSASTPKTVQVVVDGELAFHGNGYYGQILDVVIPLEAGQAIALDDQQGSWGSRVLFGPGGTEVPRRAHANAFNSPDDLYSVYQAGAAGDYRFRLLPTEPGGNAFVVDTFASVPILTPPMDGTRFEVSPAAGHPITLVDLDLTEGQRITSTVQNGDDRTWWVTPTDELLDDFEPVAFRATTTGHYSLLVKTPTDEAVPVEVAPDVEVSTTLGSPLAYDNTDGLHRTVWLTVPADAGGAVYATTDPEDVCSPYGTPSLPVLVSGPDYDYVLPDFPADTRGWVVRTSGEQLFRYVVCPGWKGSITLHSGDEVDLPTDGTPTPLEVTEDQRLVFAKLTGTPGQLYSLVASDPDPSFFWAVTVGQAPDSQYRAWVSSGDVTDTFVMPESGETYLGFTSVNPAQVVTVTIAPQGG